MSDNVLVHCAERATAFIEDRRKPGRIGGDETSHPGDRLRSIDFENGSSPEALCDDLFELLGSDAVRSDRPNYFGLFNPPALPAAIAGDLIAATVNPQLAVRGHAAAAADIERRVIEFMATRIGWNAASVAGTFTSGGSEANFTALMAAMAKRYPEWSTKGVRSLGAKPAIYASRESHLAWIKIARMAGLGSDAVRLIPCADGLRLCASDLETFLADDNEWDPVMIVATAGTTAHGAIDDIAGIARIANRLGAHLHVDAAWAGGCLVADGTRDWFDGIDNADSITIDPHKWLCVPMGAGLYLSRDWPSLHRAFTVSTGYMPVSEATHPEPYQHSVQWSRRFIGLKVFVALAALGQRGYSDLIHGQIARGQELRQGLIARGWIVRNDTPLPLVCFTSDVADDAIDDASRRIEAAVVKSGRAWLSTVALRGRIVLRACITSYECTRANVDELLDVLDNVREVSK